LNAPGGYLLDTNVVSQTRRRRADAGVIAFLAPVAGLWGGLAAAGSRPVVDMRIAATAMVHGLVLVTRNVGDFAGVGVAVVNPWRKILG
jgi:predicted nucleic acid-binding protein